MKRCFLQDENKLHKMSFAHTHTQIHLCHLQIDTQIRCDFVAKLLLLLLG